MPGGARKRPASTFFARKGNCNGLSTAPKTLITLEDLQAVRDDWQAYGARVAFVPTMGALHEGHLSLVKQARSLADRVLVSIFVNPTQFGPTEDFSKYPRTLKSDLDLLTSQDVEAVFLPNAQTMYPDGFQTYVHNTEMSQGLCGASRKNHFEGVLTVVLKLLNLARPDVALFGKKDYQQWRLIEKMAEDLHLKPRIVGSETLREADGLAMSSRNRFLSDVERKLAARLYQGLQAGQAAAKAGKREASEIVAAFQKVAGEVPGIDLEYVELRRRQNLKPVEGKLDGPGVLLCAARVGTTRLIDNLELD